jgi:hypothetical protein
MHKPTIVLSVVSLGLAVCAGYLALELKAARDALASVRAGVAGDSSETSSATQANALKPDAATMATPGPIPTQTPADTKARERILEMRDQLDDPEKRALLLRSNRQIFRQTFPRLEERLGLSDDEYTRLVNWQAEQKMRSMELQYRCAQKPACDPMAINAGQEEIYNRELTDLLGSEKLKQLTEYQDNIRERRAVEALRGALPDAQALSEAQAEKLIDALGDTRRQYARELEQRGSDTEPAWNKFGGFVISTTTVGAEAKYSEAAEFMHRQRERAAEVLTAAQLKVFTQRQEEMLDGMRTQWEYEEKSNHR